ncbi:MAG TPA: aldehyde dehydrogenase family protein [Bacteroidia bacterium]|mgnify:CR=1 FL=1|nr:aldehyde dehydrogenase family protein [Bacteroidia bacterium]
MSRLSILKTYKLFINGQFPRTESGRYYTVKNKQDKVIANVCRSSRKDFRNAVVAARSAQSGWASKSALNKSQILYRLAEMLEGRKDQIIEELEIQGISPAKAKQEVLTSIDRIIYYSGWADKYIQIFSTVNPVASSHFNFSLPEPTGVVSIIAPEEPSFLGLISVIIPVIASGNTCVVLASEKYPLNAITFAEMLATSDLPAGVVNILTGFESELVSHFANHMDVNAIVYARDNQKSIQTIMELAPLNVKRSILWNKKDWWNDKDVENPYLILDACEIKTTWHPIENIGASGGKY